MAIELDSYASPAVSPTDSSASSSEYRPATWLTRLVLGSLVVQMLLSLALAAELGWRYAVLEQMPTDMATSVATADWHERLQGALEVAVGIPYAAAWILYFGWIYRVHRNLRALGNPTLEFSPGWAIAWYFMPILSLFKPFEVMREIWHGSDPDLSDVPRDRWPTGSLALLRWWWGFHIAAYLVHYLVYYTARDAVSLEMIQRAVAVALAALLCVQIPHALLKLILVRRVYLRQQARHQRQWEEAAPIEEPTHRSYLPTGA